MSLRKVNNKRFTSDQERGFDMISNQVAVAHKTDYDTHFNKLVEKPSSLWTKVEKERNSQALNAAAATMVPSNKDQILQKHQEFFG